MVEHHEGPASVMIARYWLARKPEAFQAVRRVGLTDRVCRQPASQAATPDSIAAAPIRRSRWLSLTPSGMVRRARVNKLRTRFLLDGFGTTPCASLRCSPW